jgi:hypothetical protein
VAVDTPARTATSAIVGFLALNGLLVLAVTVTTISQSYLEARSGKRASNMPLVVSGIRSAYCGCAALARLMYRTMGDVQ